MVLTIATNFLVCLVDVTHFGVLLDDFFGSNEFPGSLGTLKVSSWGFDRWRPVTAIQIKCATGLCCRSGVGTSIMDVVAACKYDFARIDHYVGYDLRRNS